MRRKSSRTASRSTCSVRSARTGSTRRIRIFSGSGASDARPRETTGAMIDLFNAATDEKIGSITEADLKVLIDGLEEESSEDQDYFIDMATVDLLADGRATDH